VKRPPPVEPARTNGILELVHHHPGRLRVRADAFRLRADVVERVREVVEGIPGISRFSPTRRTGSILVEYRPGLVEPDEIVERIADAADMQWLGEGSVRTRRQPGLVAVGVARELNEITMELTGARADLRVIVPTALAALGVYSFAYGKEPRLPRWDNLLYWSYNIFVSLHRREIEIDPARRGPSPVRAADPEPQP
jgi:Heavy metal associated domain 2